MITGKFKLQDKAFIAGGRRFLIRERKEAKNKPKQYLCEIKPFNYISSLFEAGGAGNYTFDFEGKVYTFKLNGEEVEVEELE